MKKLGIILAAALLTLTSLGCRKETPQVETVPVPVPTPIEVEEGRELCCIAETREEAEKIAALYEIELVSYEHQVAVFHTEENLSKVLEKGNSNGWPELSVNHIVKAF